MKTDKVGQCIRTFMANQDLSLETLAQRTGLKSDFLTTIIEDDVYPSLGPLLTVNTNYKRAELANLLGQSDTQTLFIIDGYQDTDYIQTVYDLVPELKVQERGRLGSPRFPELKRVCFLNEITICYGLTENSPVMTQTLPDDDLRRRTETVGRPMPQIEVKIVDPETGRRLPAGQQGEVCCRGYSVMKGYYKMPEATAEAIDDHGWLHSGDLGALDDDGYLTITGRHKDMIIRGGENIYPREIEAFLFGMEGIMDVQVVGVPSKKYGETVGAFIILKAGADVSASDVKDFCQGQIARYKIPKHVAFVKRFPLTASGKVQKYKLQEQSLEYFPEAANE